ncbi:oligosaccharide flippase family protein [Candidatus Kapabacteria bacterium]|nr:oligosaccharide flippase family protein [Candidatus Kapabacteria bacterium]
MSRGKKLVSDTIIYGTFTILQRFLSFFMMPLYVNYLTKEDFGNITNVYSIVAVVMVLYSFGFENAFYRFYNENGKSKVFSTSFLFVVFWGLLISGTLLFSNSLISSSLSDAPNMKSMVFYASIVLFIDIIMLIPFALLRMERATLKFSIYKFITILIAIIFNIYFISYEGRGGEYSFISQIIASSCGVILISPIIIKNLAIKFEKKLFKEMFHFALPTVPAAIATLLLRTGDHILIPHLMEDGEEALAEYGANYKLALPMMMFVTTFDYAWKPFYLSSYKDSDAKSFFAKVLEVFVFIAGFIFLLVEFFLDDLLLIEIGGNTILPSSYHDGLFVISFAMGGYFFLGLNNFFSMGLNITKQTKYLPRAIGVAMLFNICANLILIPLYGYSAAAWITLLSYLISAITLYFISNKIFPINFNFKKVGLIIGFCLVLLFTNNNLNSENNIIVDFAMLVVYFSLGLYFKFVDVSILKNLLKKKKPN